MVFLDSELKTITGVKRDHWVAAAVILLLGMLLGFGGRKGFFTTVCFVADIVIFIAMTLLYVKGVDILLMTVVSCLLFAFILLFLVSGASRVTLISFCNHRSACSRRAAMFCPDLEDSQYGV